MRWIQLAEAVLAILVIMVAIIVVLVQTGYKFPTITLPQIAVAATPTPGRPNGNTIFGPPQNGYPGYARTISETQRYVGFHIIEPAYIPKTMKLEKIKIEQAESNGAIVSITYAVEKSDRSLLLTQSTVPLLKPSAASQAWEFIASGQEGYIVIGTDGIFHFYWERDGIYFSLEPTVPYRDLLEEIRQVIESMPE